VQSLFSLNHSRTESCPTPVSATGSLLWNKDGRNLCSPYLKCNEQAVVPLTLWTCCVEVTLPRISVWLPVIMTEVCGFLNFLQVNTTSILCNRPRLRPSKFLPIQHSWCGLPIFFDCVLCLYLNKLGSKFCESITRTRFAWSFASTPLSSSFYDA
jgi:hypothetical protein